MSDAALQRLLDIEEIKQLKARYFRCMDTKDWEGFRAVFARDARMIVPEGGVDLTGDQTIADTISGFLQSAVTTHHGHMPEIEITGTNTAKGVWAMFDYIEFPGADGLPGGGLKGYGHYHEEYVREDGHWKIARLELSRLRANPV
jgi:SnoaL-like domain